jgi:hypothetical protein
MIFKHLKTYYGGFKVLTEVVKKGAIIWDITPYSLLQVNRRFRETYRFCLQNQRISQARREQEEMEATYSPKRGLSRTNSGLFLRASDLH